MYRGLDNPDNLVEMRPEQHYIAHLLLARIYGIRELWFAANIMTRAAKNKGNKRFAEIRKNVSLLQSDNIKEAWAKKRGYKSYDEMAKHCWETFLVCGSKSKTSDILGFRAAGRSIDWYVKSNNLSEQYNERIKSNKSEKSRTARMNEPKEKRLIRCKNMQVKFDSKRRSESKLGAKNGSSRKVEYNGIVYDTVKELRDKFQIKNRRWEEMRRRGEVKYV